jgi:hypothetical protein
LSSEPRAFCVAAILLAALVAPAAAQVPASSSASSIVPERGFLSRADFTFEWAGLLTSDRRFDWQAQIGFDVDIYDDGSGRLRLRGDYEAVLGRERRRYDLNQGTYSFEVSGSRHVGAAEVALLSQHVSRHVVDRDNRPAISWNTVGARVATSWSRGEGFRPRRADRRRETHVDGDVEVMHAMQQAYVDYVWISRARLALGHPIAPRVDVLAAATGEVIGTNRAVADRRRVCGARVEGGLRIRGGAAALEVFATYERRIDAYPTDRFRVRWFAAGFRITTLGR